MFGIEYSLRRRSRHDGKGRQYTCFELDSILFYFIFIDAALGYHWMGGRQQFRWDLLGKTYLGKRVRRKKIDTPQLYTP